MMEEKGSQNPILKEIDDSVGLNQQGNQDLVTGNEFLRKEQQKYFANQWVLQQNYYADCGAVTKINLDKYYEARGTSKEQEHNIKLKAIIFEKLSVANTISLQTTPYDTSKDNIDDFISTVTRLQKQIDDAEEDYITYGAEIYFGIDKEIALKYFEQITPYVIGRKYLHDLKVVGNTFNDIKDGTVTKDRNSLYRFTRDLKEKRYY